MFVRLLNILFGSKNDRELKRLKPQVDKANEFEVSLQPLDDQGLAAKTQTFKKRLEAGETLDDLLPEAFAVCREMSRRRLGMRHFDVQLLGGMVLHQGRIAEMRTGEGKTLVATLPIYLNALGGKGVHLVTVNDYLAKRDAQWMGPLYHGLGLSIGIIQHDASFLFDPTYDAPDKRLQFLRPCSRREAYGADITYGTNNEFGFDYLRDNLVVTDLSQGVQRELNYAIVDEVDSILIDEARTPLIISGPAEQSTDLYFQVDRIIPHLKRDEDYTIEEKTKTVSLTDEGNVHVEKLLGVDNLYDLKHLSLVHHVIKALQAHVLYRRDVEYVVKDGEVIIVDEFTGRLMAGRRWSDGLHQAVEAKEELEISEAKSSLARVTRQRYFQRYQQICGLTGTATGNESEMRRFYGLDVQVVPPRKTNLRKVLPTRFFGNQTTKLQAIVEDVKARRVTGQPMLLGTRTISISKQLSALLAKNRLPHVLLNGIQDENESTIIAKAGHFNALTVATNMAGRGTDIKISSDGLKQGGLHVIGVEANFSARVDRQLFGRCARQGDPGSCQLFVAADDELIVASQHGLGKQIIRAAAGDGECRRDFSKEIFALQREMEHQGFEKRKELVRRDNWIDSVLETLNKEV